MKTTRYFEEQVLRKRPYLQREWCEQALTEISNLISFEKEEL